MGRVIDRRVSPVFVGRTTELSRLAAAYRQAVTEGPTVALVAGEAGIGKSRLVAEFTRGLDGARVLSGGCLDIGEDGLPYAPFVTVVRSLVRELGTESVLRLLPGRSRSLASWLPELGDDVFRRDGPDRDPEQGRARLFAEILTLIEEGSGNRPMVCVLEDLHWADTSSRELLVFLVRNLIHPPFLLIGTYRDEQPDGAQPLRPLLAELRRAPRVHLVEPAPFSRAEVAHQLAGILGAEPDPVHVGRVHERSDGNPLFVEALADAGESMPSTLRELLLGALEDMADRTRRVLRAAAVAGIEFSHDLLVSVTGLDEVDLEPAIREIVARQLLVTTESGYAFRHALIRAAVYEDLLPGERVRLHARCAEAVLAQPTLVADDRMPAELAAHCYAAGDRERALDAAWRAAEAAKSSYAYGEQARLLERVLDLWERVEDPQSRVGLDHAGVLERAAEACFASGDAERGVELVSAALDEIDSEREPERAAHALFIRSWLQIRIDAGGDTDIEAALRLLPADPPTVLRGRILVGLAGHFISVEDFERARVPAEEALEIAHHTGDANLTAWALTDMAAVSGRADDLERASRRFDEAKDAARRVGDDYLMLTAILWEACTLGNAGEHERQAAVAREGLALARRVGLLRNRGAILAAGLGWALMHLGRWSEAEEVMRDTLALDPPPVYRSSLMLFLGEIALARGDVAGAAAAADFVDGMAQRGPWVRQFLRYRYRLRCRLTVARGDPEAADMLLSQAFAEADPATHPLDTLMILTAGAEVQRARLARVARDRDARNRIAGRQAELRAVCRKLAVTGPLEEAYLVTVLAQLDDDDLAAWDEAVRAWRDIGDPYELAQSQFRAAEAAIIHGDKAGAEARAVEAATIAADLGAVPLARQIDQLVARARLSLHRPDAEPAKPDDAGDRLGLTVREFEVLRLIADGRSNRQIGEELFISPNTAGVHVSNILTKLGVASRTEAAAIAYRAGLLDEQG